MLLVNKSVTFLCDILYSFTCTIPTDIIIIEQQDTKFMKLLDVFFPSIKYFQSYNFTHEAYYCSLNITIPNMISQLLKNKATYTKTKGNAREWNRRIMDVFLFFFFYTILQRQRIGNASVTYCGVIIFLESYKDRLFCLSNLIFINFCGNT